MFYTHFHSKGVSLGHGAFSLAKHEFAFLLGSGLWPACVPSCQQVAVSGPLHSALPRWVLTAALRGRQVST